MHGRSRKPISELFSRDPHVEIDTRVTDPKHAIESCKRKATVPSRHIKVDDPAEAMQAAHTTRPPTQAATQHGQYVQMPGPASASQAGPEWPVYGMPMSVMQPQPGYAPQRMQLQTFTSIVAAAAAAGAMAAIHEMPAAHALAQHGTPEQNAAFMAAANAAASAAAAQAVALAPIAPSAQPPTATTPPSLPQPPVQPPAMSAVLPAPTAAVPVAQQEAQPEADEEAARPATSDTSAHQPPQAQLHEQVELQRIADAPDSAAAQATEASPFEQALIKRLQLYAWLVRHRLPIPELPARHHSGSGAHMPLKALSFRSSDVSHRRPLPVHAVLQMCLFDCDPQ